MSKSNKLNPLAATVGAAFLATSMGAATTHASENPFATTDLSAGYQLASKHEEGKCGEGKCGEEKADKKSEGSCGEEKKGDKKDDKKGEGKCGDSA